MRKQDALPQNFQNSIEHEHELHYRKLRDFMQALVRVRRGTGLAKAHAAASLGCGQVSRMLIHHQCDPSLPAHTGCLIVCAGATPLRLWYCVIMEILLLHATVLTWGFRVARFQLGSIVWKARLLTIV
jgi:hypothetical protein